MADAVHPQVYSIAAHRGFADALVAGLIPRYAEPELGLARLTLLLPSRRAERIVTEAFVRLSGGGLLLPRIAVVGDLDLDETLGPLLDPLGAGSAVPPAADPVRRWLRLAELLRSAIIPTTPSGNCRCTPVSISFRCLGSSRSGRVRWMSYPASPSLGYRRLL